MPEELDPPPHVCLIPDLSTPHSGIFLVTQPSVPLNFFCGWFFFSTFFAAEHFFSLELAKLSNFYSASVKIAAHSIFSSANFSCENVPTHLTKHPVHPTYPGIPPGLSIQKNIIPLYSTNFFSRKLSPSFPRLASPLF